MKKLALLLGSLLVVGATASAKEVIVVAEPVVEFVAPAPVYVADSSKLFTPVSVKFWYENDNTSGASESDLGANYLGMDFKMKSENWDYTFTAYKAWTLSSDDGVVGTSNRFQVDAMRSFNKDGEFQYKLGTRVRMQDSYDRYYLKGSYDYGMFSGWGYTGYTSVMGGTGDRFYSEVMPVIADFGWFSLGYYLESDMYVGSVHSKEDTLDHELRLGLPLYNGEAFTASLEYRLGLSGDGSVYGVNAKGDYLEKDWGFGDHNGLQLSLGYKFNESVSLDGYYLYEVTDFDDMPKSANNNYGELYVGVTYKF